MLLTTQTISVARFGAPALHLPDIHIAERGRVLLLGPSGSGKTTLLSVLAGLLRPHTGHVLVKGRDLYAMTPRERDHVRGQTFGFVFQTLHLLPSLSLRQNVALAADMADARRDEARLTELLAGLGLSDKAHRKPEALSQGEQQRAAIARAVLNRPALILADEPTSALDDANAQAVIDLLDAQAQVNGAALLIATHDHRIINRFDRVVTLGDAKGVAA